MLTIAQKPNGTKQLEPQITSQSARPTVTHRLELTQYSSLALFSNYYLPTHLTCSSPLANTYKLSHSTLSGHAEYS